MLKTYGSNNLYFFFFFFEAVTNVSEFGVIHVLCYKYYCFCSLEEELGIKLETQRHPGMYTESTGVYLPCAGSELGECRQRLPTYRISHSSCTTISRALGTEQTRKQNKHPLPQATPCLQSTKQRRELQSNLCTITQQHQAPLGIWSTTSFWVTVP